MDTKKIQAWLSAHKFEAGLFVLVLGVIAFIAIRNKSSSNTAGKKSASLDTIHGDLQTIDFDLNQLMTTSVTNPWVSNIGLSSGIASMPGQSVPSQALGAAPPTPGVLTSNEVVALEDLQAQYSAAAQTNRGISPQQVAALSQAAQADIGSTLSPSELTQLSEAYSNIEEGAIKAYNPSSNYITQLGNLIGVTGQGEGRPQSNYTWEFKGMGLEGRQLPDSFYADEYHQLEPGGVGLWGDYNFPVRLN